MIPARPTIYRGIQMRSRLEARVAAWFDRHEIPWVYEPLNFNDGRSEYLPDFEIKDFGVGGREKRPIYVEAKPTSEQADACRFRMTTIWRSQPSQTVLADLLVLAPGHLDFITGGQDQWCGDRGGWRGSDGIGWAEAGFFHRCTGCGQTSLLIWELDAICARCGKRLTITDLDAAITVGKIPIPCERGGE